jgi:transposase
VENITIAPQLRKSFITEMKRETKPSRRLRMHIILLASEGRSPTEIAHVLFCSRTTIYAVVDRFAGEGRVAFDDRKPRGPEPLLGKRANERVEHLVEEDSPTDHGWLRSRWSCKLIALQLFGERAALLVSSERSTSGWKGRRLELGRVSIYLVELSRRPIPTLHDPSFIMSEMNQGRWGQESVLLCAFATARAAFTLT